MEKWLRNGELLILKMGRNNGVGWKWGREVFVKDSLRVAKRNWVLMVFFESREGFMLNMGDYNRLEVCSRLVIYLKLE